MDQLRSSRKVDPVWRPVEHTAGLQGLDRLQYEYDQPSGVVNCFTRQRRLSLLKFVNSQSSLKRFDLCKSLMKSISENLSSIVPDECFSIILHKYQSSQFVLTPFSLDRDFVSSTIDNFDEKYLLQRDIDFVSLIEQALSEVTLYHGVGTNVLLYVLTDGNTSAFEPNNNNQTFVINSHWANVFVNVVSLLDARLSHDLTRIQSMAGLGSCITSDCRPNYQTSAMVNQTIERLAKLAIDSGLQSNRHFGGDGSLDFIRSGSCVTVKCGHLRAQARIKPGCLALPSNFVADLFGFIHASDASNPPVVSRHVVTAPKLSPDAFASVENLEEQEADQTNSTSLLMILLKAMQRTKTIAMLTIRSDDKEVDDDDDKKTASATTDDNKLCYGFLHYHDLQNPILLLSLFDKACDGLDWLGKFDYLAPCEDFADLVLYDNGDGSKPGPSRTPFPVQSATLPSYFLTANQPPVTDPVNQIKHPSGCEPMRYVTWASSANQLTADIAKVLRLSRRLPEKAPVLFKELARLRSGALAYGMPDLLTQVGSRIQAMHQHTAPPDLLIRINQLLTP